MGLWNSLSSICMSMELIAVGRQLGTGTTLLHRRGGEARKLLSSSKANWHISVQVKLCIFYSTSKKGRQCSADLEINLLRAVTWPVSCWTSFLKVGCHISSIARIFSEFASMSCWMTIKPSNFLAVIPNAHFLGFNFMRWRGRLSKASFK